MRTIKFRGKKISNSKWINGYYIVDPMGKSQILHNFVFHTVITETVGQFTGRRGENPKVRGKTLVKELGKMYP